MAQDAPEVVEVEKTRVSCDGGGADGHPRVWLQMPSNKTSVECPYCDCKYVLKEGADTGH
ncbi:MAG: zinc-finger domain-containing protein [Amylibacter sp.]|nr:zinc-finger domain-containing protein [Amylibacter sp.]